MCFPGEKEKVKTLCMKNFEFTYNDIDKIIDSLNYHLSMTHNFETKYFDSYFEFVKYFEKIERIDYHSLVISSYFTYGWMPTILKNFDVEDNVSSPIENFNKVKMDIEIDDAEYMNLVKCINNSIVGVSKLLHFINPSQYPIFDSRIKNYFKSNDLLKSIWKPTYQNKEKDIQQYKLYRDVCLSIINNSRFETIFEESIQKLNLGRELTKMRVLENLFFSFGGKKEKKVVL